MYEIFEEIMRKKGITPYQVAKGTGIRQGVLTDWKMGRYVPKADKRQKIADFLGVSLHYLDTGEIEETVTLTEEERDVLQVIHDNPHLRALLSVGKDLDADDFAAVKDYAERLRRSYKD